MPNLQKLVKGGVMGNLSTLNPVLSPMLWSSIATGKRPYKHGIYGFSEPDPISGSIRPVTNLSRKTKAFWNILNQNEKKTITVGWWPSNPAEPLSRGVMVSNDFHHSEGETYDPEKWPMKPGSVHPKKWEEKIKELRFHPAELYTEDLLSFMPGLVGLSQEELDKVSQMPQLRSLMKTIADCTSVHAAATGLMANEEWDMFSVYYDAIDHFGHGFMKYHPPQQKGVSDEDFRLFSYIIEAGYIFHDMMLGTLVDLAREIDSEVNVMLISDHGFHPDDQRLVNMPDEPAGPAAEHRKLGILVASGPDLKKNERVYGAGLLDICPTILDLFGLPIGDDMDGRILNGIYETKPRRPEPITSWDEVDGDHGMHDPEKQIAPEDSKAALDQLVALGYIDEPNEDQSVALENTVRELDYNLAQAWMDGGIYTNAIDILEPLYTKWPDEHRFGYQLVLCYQSLRRLPEMQETISCILERRSKEAEDAQEQIKALKLDDEEVQKSQQEVLEKMSDKEKKAFQEERKALFTSASPNLFSMRQLEAKGYFLAKDYDRALELLQELEEHAGARIQTEILRGQCYTALKVWEKALQSFHHALEIDPEITGALNGLGKVHLLMGDYTEAISAFRSSIGLLYFQPQLHYMLGLSYYRLQQYELAEKSLIIAVTQAPLLAAGYRLLGQIARFHRYDSGKIIIYKSLQSQAIAERKKLRTKRASLINHKDDSLPFPEISFPKIKHEDDPEIITIVTGLPRSGTSLMMQIIEAAGIPLYTDNKRKADSSNSKGYYEHDRVKGIMNSPDKSWLLETRGKAVKVVAPLLAFLPKAIKVDQEVIKLNYRILFMDRVIAEIIDSQEKMLTRSGKEIPKGDVKKAYRQQVNNALHWIRRHNLPSIAVKHIELINEKEGIKESIKEFLKSPMDKDELFKVVNPELHRSKFNT